MKTDTELLIEELNRLIRYDNSPVGPVFGILINKPLLNKTIEALGELNGAYEQVKWERDITMEQLNTHEIPFAVSQNNSCECCHPRNNSDLGAKIYYPWEKHKFCPICGRRILEG